MKMMLFSTVTSERENSREELFTGLLVINHQVIWIINQALIYIATVSYPISSMTLCNKNKNKNLKQNEKQQRQQQQQQQQQQWK